MTKEIKKESLNDRIQRILIPQVIKEFFIDNDCKMGSTTKTKDSIEKQSG